MANILIGISGSVAAYKSVQYLRELVKSGHNCRVILSDFAQKFVTPELIAALGATPYTEDSVNLQDPTAAMTHINLAKWADFFIIAPASANTIAKLAHGLADNLLTQTVLAYNTNKSPIYLAPAMNQQMWHNAIVQENLAHLKQHNFTIWEPDSGLQACGDVGIGRLLEPEELLRLTFIALTAASTSQNPLESHHLQDKKIVITLGATIEPIDPVRYISNHSSGKMGLALINSALRHGVQVVAICGNISITLPNSPSLNIIKAPSAIEMLHHSLEESKDANMFIGAAAVADYRVTEISPQKIKKNSPQLTLNLSKNPDIIAEIKKAYPELLVIGFAAETENLIANATTKLKRKALDLIIANDVSNHQIFAQTNTRAHLIFKHGTIQDFIGSKQELADRLFNLLFSL